MIGIRPGFDPTDDIQRVHGQAVPRVILSNVDVLTPPPFLLLPPSLSFPTFLSLFLVCFVIVPLYFYIKFLYTSLDVIAGETCQYLQEKKQVDSVMEVL